MKILGIDSGLEKTGYAILEKNSKFSQGFKYISSGIIKTTKNCSLSQRLENIYSSLKKIVDKYEFDVIVLERIFFFKNKKTIINVSQAQGVTMLLAAQKKINLEFLTPLQIKSAVTGNGKADKESVKKMIDIILKESKINIIDDDQSDAIACALTYCYLYQNPLQ